MEACRLLGIFVERTGFQVCHSEERSDVGISQYHVGYHESSGENVTAFPRLHPKGTSSRFALRAPRPRWGLAMTNLGALRCNVCRSHCQSARRSLSAATDTIGFYGFIDALYELPVPSQDCHVGLRPPRNDKSGAVTILTIHCTNRPCSAGPGCPLPYKVQPGRQYRYCYIDSDYSIGQGGCQPGNDAGTQ